MREDVKVIGILMEKTHELSLVEVCHVHCWPKSIVIELLEQGLIRDVALSPDLLMFDYKMVDRLQRAYRLQQDLELNAAGVVLVMELLDELDQLRETLAVLKHHVE